MTDDVALFDKPTADTTAHLSELQLVRVAFAELPQRWQIVLWRTAVDKDSNIEVGEAMGLSPNGVAALAKRARRGFRLSYLRAHLSDRGVEARCKPFIDGLADLSISEAGASPALTSHVAGCVACTHRLDELRAVNVNFAGIVGPAVLGLVPAKILLGGSAVGLGASAAGAGSSSTASPLVGVDGPLTNIVSFRPGARWALGSAALAGAVVAILLAARPEVTPLPPVAQPLPNPTHTSARPSTSTSRPVPTPSATTLERPSATTPPTPRTKPTRPAAPRPSSPTPTTLTTTPPRTTSTTTPPRTSPLSVNLSLAGPASATSVHVAASAQGIDGPLRLTLQLPDGVTMSGAVGDWRSCAQSQGVVTCAASAAAAGRWSGTIQTTWTADAQGRVRATVNGTYATGSPASGSVGTTWPP